MTFFFENWTYQWFIPVLWYFSFLNLFNWKRPLDTDKAMSTFMGTFRESILAFVPNIHENIHLTAFPSWFSKDLKTVIYNKNTAHANKMSLSLSDYHMFSTLRLR